MISEIANQFPRCTLRAPECTVEDFPDLTGVSFRIVDLREITGNYLVEMLEDGVPVGVTHHDDIYRALSHIEDMVS